MTQNLPLTIALGPEHGDESIGYRVLKLDRTVYSAFATSGVSESFVAGTYYVSGGISAPDAGGYVVVGTATEDYAEAAIEPCAPKAQEVRDAMLLAPGAGAPAPGSVDARLDAIQAKTGLIGGAGTMTVVSPVASSGDVSIDRGYDYYAVDGRALAWTDDAPATWPNLTGAAAVLHVGALSVAGAISNPTGPATITVEMSRVQTAALVTGAHPFRIDVALANGHLILQVRGTLVAA